MRPYPMRPAELDAYRAERKLNARSDPTGSALLRLPAPWAALQAGLLLALPGALGLGGDLLQLHRLQGRQRSARRALPGVAEGAAVGLHPLLDRAQELALPLRQLDARPLGGAARLLQRAQRRALGQLLGIGRLSLHASPMADR